MLPPTHLRRRRCPELPDQIAEMELVESSEWGATKRVGMSKPLHLCQGATFQLKYEDDRTGEVNGWLSRPRHRCCPGRATQPSHRRQASLAWRHFLC